jgi:hypothetical protein
LRHEVIVPAGGVQPLQSRADVARRSRGARSAGNQQATTTARSNHHVAAQTTNDRFQVEKLEGRSAPSVIATSAVLDLSDRRFAHIYGYTTSPTKEGEILEIKATEHIPGESIKLKTFAAFTEVAPTIVPGRTGAFSARVESISGLRFARSGTFAVLAINITSRSHPHEVDRTTTEQVPVTSD